MLLDRDAYPPGVPCWVDTWQPDVAAAAEFYGALFGWEFDDPTPHYRVAQLGGSAVAAVGSQLPGAPPEATWNTYVAVASADEAVQCAKAAGGELLAGLFDIDDSGRMAARGRRGCAAVPVAGGHAHGRAARQRAGFVELEQPRNGRCGRGAGLLLGRLRLGGRRD